jgi:hypothetical protein
MQRVFILAAAAGAVLLAAGMAGEPASAQEDACKSQPATASGRAKFRPFTKSKELEGKGSAMADAIANWQRLVSDQFGESYRLWTEAKDKSFKCEPMGEGKLISGNRIGCTITGRPCAHAEIAPGVPGNKVIVEDLPEKGKRSSRNRYVERPARYISPESRREQRRYEREMELQMYLAEQRHKAENRRYEREMAYQRYLQRQRERREAIGWERENARQRYEAERMRMRAERERHRAVYQD